MKAKDTVINTDKLGAFNVKDMLKHQAEISFKAGQEEERAFILQNTDRDKRTRFEGIREVVEWVDEQRLKGEGSFSKSILFQGDIEIRKRHWQAQKEKWGIDNG